ncbi:MAG: acetyltransferase [Bacteroidota bacterium]
MVDIRQNNRKKVIIVGASGHAAEINDYIDCYNEKQELESDKISINGFIDDNPKNYSRYQFSGAYLGDIKSHQVDKRSRYIMAIANIKFRKTIVEYLKRNGAKFITLIHPTAYMSKSSIIGEGVLIGPGVNIGPNVKVGDFNIINSRSSLGHDTIIGDYNFITPNVCFSGFTKVGNENMFGINSATIPNISIGSGNTIAAGMIIDKNVKDGATIFHRFKEKVIVMKQAIKKAIKS